MTNVNVRGLGGQQLGVKVEIQRFASVDEFEQVSRTRVMDALPFPHAHHAVDNTASASAYARGCRSADVRHVFGSAMEVAPRGMVRVRSHLLPEPEPQP